MKKISLTILLFCCICFTYAQNITASGRDGSAKSNNAIRDTSIYKLGGDTLGYTLPTVRVYTSLRTFKNKRDQKRYDRLVYHIKKVYPYAKKAAEVLHEEEAKIAGMSESERKNHMKKVEKRIEDEFGKDIRNLSFTQGKILLKLIDRETGYTSYELLESLRGKFRAWFYNGIAKMFDYNLKSEFDPHDHLEDRYIDEVVRAIEAGEISLTNVSR